MSYITAIETALPPHKHSRKAIVDFFMRTAPDENTKRKIKVVAAKSGIETRYSVLSDFGDEQGRPAFFANSATGLEWPGLSARMTIFKTEALALSLNAVKKIKNFEKEKHSITHLITVTCTGLFAPGLDAGIAHSLGLSVHVLRSSVNFMGCNAAIIALRQADAICRSNKGAKVLVVCTELCTIHFRKIDSDDYILSTSLFADGSAAALVTGEKTNEEQPAFKIENFSSLLIPDNGVNMAWQLSEDAFLMNLSSYVSQLLNGKMKELMDNLKIDKNEVDAWALHPGGIKILDDFAKALSLNKSNLAESYEVLKNYGNMSSVTVLFVLKAILENRRNIKPGANVFSAAFGPGLSVETMQAKYV